MDSDSRSVVGSNFQSINPPLPPPTQGSTTGPLQIKRWTVNPGEDVALTINAHLEQLQNLDVFSVDAEGFISTLTLSRGLLARNVVYQGHYHIVKVLVEPRVAEPYGNAPQRRRRLRMIISDELNGVFGAWVTGPVIAATPVTVTMMLFGPEPNRDETLEARAGPAEVPAEVTLSDEAESPFTGLRHDG